MIGQKIKQARMKNKLTQQQVADKCQLSKSMLSKIENGQTSAAVATLSRICESLHISLSWVLDGNPESDLVVLARKQRKYSIGNEHMGYTYELLANRAPFSMIEPTIVHVTPKDANLRCDPYTHSQDEFIYILEGSICLLYNHEKREMHEGDSAYFKGVNPHLFVPVDNKGAKVLTIFIDG